MTAAEKLALATHRALKDRLGRLDRASLERVAHVYLLRQGWRNLTWIKHVSQASYAVGDPPGGLDPFLIGVRAGRDPVDRRGIGELRVGVQAKNLVSGLLIACEGLSDIALQELRRPGPSISLLVGDSFVSALAQSGIGTTVGQVPAICFDGGFFDDVESV